MSNNRTKLDLKSFNPALFEGVAPFKTQEQVVKEAIDYATKRSLGQYEYLKTDYTKLNKAIQGGFDWNTMLTVSGLSSSGKSTLSSRLVSSMVKNAVTPCIVLKFNFEMMAHKVVAREICNMANIDMKTLFSVDSKLTSTELNNLIEDYYNKVIDYPILYVEEPQNYANVVKTIFKYWETLCKEQNIGLIVEIDHSSIVMGGQKDGLKERISNLMEGLNAVKKKIGNLGGKVFFIIVSQMNRNIKSVDRKMNKSLHYPATDDLYAASEVEFYSDYILFTHNPSKLNLPDGKYTDSDFPCWLGSEDGSEIKDTQFIYWTLAKNRDGELVECMPMLSKLKYYDFEEVDRDDFMTYWQDFKSHGACYRIPKK